MKHLQRNLFIGLGGIGIKTILETKAQVLNHCSKEGVIPSCVGFLGIDTDVTALDCSVASKCGVVCLSPHERFYAGGFHAKEYYCHHKSELTWIPKQNVQKLVPLTHGSGMVRSNGRFAFMYHHRNLFDHLKRLLFENMCSVTGCGHSIKIHIVFSLHGGTGSGMFVDMAYLIREVARGLGIKIFLKGYGVMPGVSMGERDTWHAKDSMLSNTYAALRELDYLMSLNPASGNSIKMPWMDNRTSETPFDNMILVDNVNANGFRLRRTNDMIQVLSMALMDL